MTMTSSRMMAQQQKAVRGQNRGRRRPGSSSPSSANSSRSGSRTPKATNVHTHTNSDNFDQIWKDLDLVADHKIFPTEDRSSHHPLESSIEYYSQGLALLATVKRTNPSGAKESLIEFAWLRRCVADKNLYYNRVETYRQDDNVI